MIQTRNHPAVSQLAFAMLLCASAVVILRPSELVPALQGMPIFEGCISGALLLGIPGLLRHAAWRNLRQQPATLSVLSVLVAIVASQLSRVSFDGLTHNTLEFAKILLFFGLVVSLTDTVARLRRLLMLLALCATAAISLSVLDYLDIYDFQFITHISDVGEVAATNERLRVIRLCGLGIFHDPNDLSLLIVFSGIVCAYFLLDRSRGPIRLAWLGPLVVLAVALIFTKSRGGLLSAGVGLLSLVACRHGMKAGIVVGLLGLCALPFISGRQADIDLVNGGTGHERLLLWRDGLMALRSPLIFFGIGRGMYAEWAGMVAHNSFVHAYVELGLFGGTLFLGCFFFPALTLWRLRHRRHDLAHDDLRTMYPFFVAILAAWTMGLQSLSHTYSLATYLMLGIQVVFANLAGAHLQPRQLVVTWDRSHLFRLAALSVTVFVGFNVFIIVLAR